MRRRCCSSSLVVAGCRGAAIPRARPKLPPGEADTARWARWSRGWTPRSRTAARTVQSSCSEAAAKTPSSGRPSTTWACCSRRRAIRGGGEGARGRPELAPNAEDVAVALAEVRRRRGEPRPRPRARTFVRPSQGGRPRAMALVSALRESGKHRQRIEHAREVLLRRPNDPNALAELALAHLGTRRNRHGRAPEHESLKAAEKSGRGRAHRRAHRAEARRRRHRVPAFRQRERNGSQGLAARLNMGTVLLQAGISDRAEMEFRAVLAVKPEDSVRSSVWRLRCGGRGRATSRGRGSRRRRC